jgi:hypothetical protein
MAIQTLTGNEFEAGSAIDNTQTDQFVLQGASNTVLEGAGNIQVTGGGSDTNSTVLLDAASGTTDTVTLNGSANALLGLGDLSDSTVTFTVSPASGGGNAIDLANHGGTTTVSLGGVDNTVTLNSDATNSISTGGGATISIGSAFDDVFGSSTTISLGGGGNSVTTGDANTRVSGGGSGGNTVALGDGANSVSLAGTANHISVGGGANSIDAGGSGAVVHILGADGASAPAVGGDDGLGAHPADDVTIAGAGDLVTATYEDVFVNGLAVTSAATVTLGNGDDIVTLGGTGGDTVTVGNGINQVAVSGDKNTVTVIDPTGVGNTSVNLKSGQNDTVAFDHAGGAVADTATTGVTTITQAGANQVIVNLNGGTGAIKLGDGHDTVTANGAGSVITLGSGKDVINAGGAGDTIKFGNGADVVTANGNGDSITGGGGANTVTANGTGDTISLGNGANAVTANGGGDTIKVGNGANTITAAGTGDTITAGSGANTITASGGGDKITAGNGNNTVTANGNTDTIGLGSGNNTVTALGSGDTVTIAANALSHDSVALGASDSLRISGGTDKISLAGAGDTVSANALLAGSQITGNGNGEMLFLGSNSSSGVHLNPVGTGEQVTVQALDATTAYTGSVEISGFGLGDTISLNGLGFSSFGQVLAHMTFGPTQDTLSLTGGGKIAFDMPTAFSASEFKFSTTHGAV